MIKIKQQQPELESDDVFIMYTPPPKMTLNFITGPILKNYFHCFLLHKENLFFMCWFGSDQFGLLRRC